MTEGTRYLAFLLRLWVTRQDETLVYRVALENPHTGERRAFADLETLFDYLRRASQDLPDALPGLGPAPAKKVQSW